tara:strand:+ start:443 stop:1885 length:1443 start_codon:yes stop_codon:yes gene_type:complete
MKKLTLLLLILLSTTLKSNSEEATSGNLLPNAGTGQTSYQNSSGSIDGITSGTGWTMSGSQYLSNEIEVQGTGTVSANGSLLNLNTTKATDGASFTTTADSLDGGVRLDSTTEVQNCEWSGSAYACGQHTAGRDSYSTTVKILDDAGAVLNSVTQNRNTDAGYYGNTFTYTDTVAHTGTGARNWSWEFSGLDGDSPNSTSLVGPNLLGAELTATLLDLTYSPIPTATLTEFTATNEELFREFEKIEETVKFEEEFKLEEEFKFEEEFPTVSMYEEPKLESFQTMEEPKMNEPKMVEEFSEPMVEEKEEKEPQMVTLLEEENALEEKEKEPEPASLAEQFPAEEENESESEPKTEEAQTEQAEGGSTGTSLDEKKNVSLVKTFDKIDQQIKDVDKNLKVKNIIKINAMIDNSILLTYNVPFYKERKIYEDQLDIYDDRLLYTKTLGEYQQNDPIFIQQNEIDSIRLQKQKLLQEIKVLENG